MKKILDLCSGLGGATEAFVQSDNWEVLRIENNPVLAEVPHTLLMNIFELRDLIEASPADWVNKVEVVWASPPCLDYSTAYDSPRSRHSREFPNVPYVPSVSIMYCCMDIIRLLKPKYWILENVRGSIIYFKGELGEPRQINDAYVFWGTFPTFSPAAFESKSQKDKRHSPIRANIRAKVPMAISEALLEAIEMQKSILDY